MHFGDGYPGEFRPVSQLVGDFQELARHGVPSLIRDQQNALVLLDCQIAAEYLLDRRPHATSSLSGELAGRRTRPSGE
jgi:hypothetical protein